MRLQAIDKRTRRAVLDAGDGLPALGEWLNRVRAIGHPALTEAIEGIWCGREGRVSMDLPGFNCMLVVGWYNGRVEYGYVS